MRFRCGLKLRVTLRPKSLAICGRGWKATPIARYGVFGVSTWPIGCDTPSTFSERFPHGEHAKWRCDTPPLKRGISAILARYPMETRQMGAIPPFEILSRKGIARYGGVSRTGPLKVLGALYEPDGIARFDPHVTLSLNLG